MAYEKVQDLDCETTVAVGGRDKKTGKANPKSAEGYFLGSKVTQSKYGESFLHILQTPEGNLGVWGKTDMDRKLKAVTPGTMVRITDTGKTKPSKKGNDMIVYLVEHDPDNTIEVRTVNEPRNIPYEGDVADTEEEETDVDGDEQALDEVQTAPVTRRSAATTPSAAAQARTRALVSGRR